MSRFTVGQRQTACRRHRRVHRRFGRAIVALTLLVACLPGGAVECPSELAGGPACSGEASGSWSPPSADARYLGNPVDVVTGNKYERRTDYRAFGSRLSFVRHYNSAHTDTDTGLGRGWRHDFDLSLGRLADGSGLRLVQGDGRLLDFLPAGTYGAHLSRSGSDGRITIETGAYVWHVPDGRRIRFHGARPVTIDWPDGETLALRWHRGRLVTVTDRHGRTLELTWTPGRLATLDGYEPAMDVTLPGHLAAVRLPNGDRLEYRFDNLRRLRGVSAPEGTIERLSYEDPDLPAALTTTERDGRISQWSYDGDGRVASHTDADGNTRRFGYEILSQEVTTSSMVGTTGVTREDGGVTEIWWQRNDGRARLLEVTEIPCPGCVGAPRQLPLPNTSHPTLQSSDTAPSATTESLVAIDGLTVERIGADGAIVHTVDSGERRTFRFDRRGRLIDTAAARDDRDALTQTVTVDARGTMYRRKDGTTTVCPLAVGRTCDELERDMEYAQMSICAYDPNTCGVSGWSRVNHQTLGVEQDLMSHGNYHTVGYRNDLTGEYAIAFRGTESFSDLLTDAGQFNGLSFDYARAAQLAEALDTHPGAITFTGHSLGGGLAATAALAGNRTAVGFNSAALTEQMADRLQLNIDEANQSVTNILVPDDIVTELQDQSYRDNADITADDDYDREVPTYTSHPAPGRRHTLNAPSQQLIEETVRELPWFARALLTAEGEKGVAAHLMTSVVAALNGTIATRCGMGP